MNGSAVARRLVGSLCAAALLLPLGCDPPEELALAPQVLHDEAEMQAYLEDFPRGSYEIVQVPGLGRFWLDDHAGIIKSRLRSGQPHSPQLIEQFERHVVPGTTVLDVGAHIGSLTVPLARLVGPQGRVYAFEPQRKLFRELVHNLRLNGLDNAIPLRFALSSGTGIVEMDPVRTHDGQVSVGSGGDPVEARAIDSFGFSEVSLIKIDVEGHEAEVLRGAGQTIRRFHPVILIEIWPKNFTEVAPVLRELRYALDPFAPDNYVATFAGPVERR